MKYGCNWKRVGDKVKFYDMEFKNLFELNDFFEKFFKSDCRDEIIELRIWQLK